MRWREKAEAPLRATEGGRRGIREAIRPELPVYMDRIELAQVVAAARALGPRTILEWGSGGSSAALLGACPTVERYVSIEHHAEWAERVRGLIDDPRFELHHVPAAEPEPEFPRKGPERTAAMEAWMTRGETERALFADYVARPAALGLEPQLALVDGRARVFCMEAAWSLMASGGVILLHDAQREAYRAFVERCEDHVFLEPWRQGQVCLLRKP